MSGIAASAGQVVFIPKDGDSYFYEALGCQQPVTNGYGGIQFTVQGPAGGSFALDLQTTASCANGTDTRKSSYNIVSDLTGRLQTITMPLIGFDNDPNYDSIVALVWSSFSVSNVQWSIGSISFVCGDVSAGQTSGRSQPLSSVESLPNTHHRAPHEVDLHTYYDPLHVAPARHVPAGDVLEPAD